MQITTLLPGGKYLKISVCITELFSARVDLKKAGFRTSYVKRFSPQFPQIPFFADFFSEGAESLTVLFLCPFRGHLGVRWGKVPFVCCLGWELSNVSQSSFASVNPASASLDPRSPYAARLLQSVSRQGFPWPECGPESTYYHPSVRIIQSPHQ